MKRLPIYLIAALSENNVIGYKGKLPWYLSTDLQYFKKMTLHHPIIMGRKTWESIGQKPLPHRVNIVVTRQTACPLIEEVFYAKSLEDAYKIATQEGKKIGAEAMFVVGGAALYKAAMADVQKLYLTKVMAYIEGDTYFPSGWENAFERLSSHFVKAGAKDQYNMCMEIFQRVS